MGLSAARRQALGWAAIAATFAAMLWLLGPVLTPFLVAAVFAYAMHPMVERLVRRRVPRALAVIVVEVVVLVLLLSILLLIVPILSNQLPLMREQIPLLADRVNRGAGPWLAQFGVKIALDPASIKAFTMKHLGANLEDWLATVLTSARIGGSYLLAAVGNAVLVPVVTFYFLMDWPRLIARLHDLVPLRMRADVDAFLTECDGVLGQYLRGQLLVMLALATYYAVGLTLFGFDLALPVGIFTGLAVFIPYLGFGLGLAMALLAAVLQFANAYGILAVAAVYGVGQVLESFVLTPRLVGERIGLNPLAVIFALLAFGHLLGFTGVLIALPASAVLLVAVRRVLARYRASQLYTG